MSRQVSRGSAGEYQQMSRQVSRGSAGEYQQMSRQVSPGSAGEYQQMRRQVSRGSADEYPLTVAHQAPLAMGFPRQEYWSGLPFPLPEDLLHQGIKTTSLASPALAGRFFTAAPPGKP